MYFTEKATSPWKKRERGKDFGCENYLKIESKKAFYNTSERLTIIPLRIILKNFGMDAKSFEESLSWVAPFIQKSSLRRSAPTVQERLCVTLRYLCTGDSQITIDTSYRISSTKMGRIISETCQAIWYVLNNKGFITAPTSKSD